MTSRGKSSEGCGAKTTCSKEDGKEVDRNAYFNGFRIEDLQWGDERGRNRRVVLRPKIGSQAIVEVVQIQCCVISSYSAEPDWT